MNIPQILKKSSLRPIITLSLLNMQQKASLYEIVQCVFETSVFQRKRQRHCLTALSLALRPDTLLQLVRMEGL